MPSYHYCKGHRHKKKRVPFRVQVVQCLERFRGTLQGLGYRQTKRQTAPKKNVVFLLAALFYPKKAPILRNIVMFKRVETLFADNKAPSSNPCKNPIGLRDIMCRRHCFANATTIPTPIQRDPQIKDLHHSTVILRPTWLAAKWAAEAFCQTFDPQSPLDMVDAKSTW